MCMHGSREYRRGSGGGGPGPSATSFFSHQLNFRFFSKKTIISKTPGVVQYFLGGPTFPGDGGGGGGGGVQV